MIPYTVERRADTNVTNVTMGIWLFLASEVMLFGALFSAYALLRTAATTWPHGSEVLTPALGLTNTGVLLLGSILVGAAGRVDRVVGQRLIVAASGLAVGFLVIKGVEYGGEFSRGLYPSTSTFLATYFTLTGLHALHIVGGLVANLWAATGPSRVGDAMTIGRFRALGYYWAFVDVVWLLILVLMYLS